MYVVYLQFIFKLVVKEIRLNLQYSNSLLKENLVELFLFTRLRIFSLSSGGNFSGFVFTKNELYNVLPKLEKLGLVDTGKNKVIKYRSILKSNNITSRVFFDIGFHNLTSLKTFKAYLLAVNERYVLGFKESKRFDGTLIKSRRVRKKGDLEFIGRVFNDELSNLMGISKSTISRWRSDSKDEGYNAYSIKFKNAEVFARSSNSSKFKSNSNGKLITKDLIVRSSINIFHTKHI